MSNDAAQTSDESMSLEDVIASAPPVPIEGANQAIEEQQGEVQAAEEPKPIDAAAVAGDKKSDSLPDSSLVSSRFNQQQQAQQAIEDRRADEQRYRELEEEVRVLRALRRGTPEFQERYDAAQDKIDDAADPQSKLMQEMQNRLDQLEARHQQYQQEDIERRERAQLYEAKNEVSSWVKSQKEHFPLINKLGEQGLVFDKMLASRASTGTMMSEADAGREVEAGIEKIVHECAPLLGYTQGEVRSESDESVSIGTSGFNVSEPKDRDAIGEEGRLDHLIREYEAQQR